MACDSGHDGSKNELITPQKTKVRIYCHMQAYERGGGAFVAVVNDLPPLGGKPWKSNLSRSCWQFFWSGSFSAVVVLAKSSDAGRNRSCKCYWHTSLSLDVELFQGRKIEELSTAWIWAWQTVFIPIITMTRSNNTVRVQVNGHKYKTRWSCLIGHQDWLTSHVQRNGL